MRKYFIVDGFQRKGPYTIEELKKNGITKDTLIWFFELGDNKPAGEIPEIAGAFDDNVLNANDGEQIDTDTNKPDLSEADLLKIYEESKKTKEIEDFEKKEQPKNDKKRKISAIVDSVKIEKEAKIKKIEEQKSKEEQSKLNIVALNENIENPKFEEPELVQNLEEKTISEPPPIFEQKAQTYNQTTKKTISQPPPKPKNYVIGAIFVTVLCCMPLGVVGVIMGASVDRKYRAGDYYGAEKASKNTKTLLYVAMTLGVIFFILMYIIGSNS